MRKMEKTTSMRTSEAASAGSSLKEEIGHFKIFGRKRGAKDPVQRKGSLGAVPVSLRRGGGMVSAVGGGQTIAACQLKKKWEGEDGGDHEARLAVQKERSS